MHVRNRATVVDYLTMSTNNDTTGIACFFCNYQNRSQQTPSNIVADLLKQLMLHRVEPLAVSHEIKELYTCHSQTDTRPRFHELHAALRRETRDFTKVFIAIDAVDELSLDEEDLAWLLCALESLGPHVSLMFTSRILTSHCFMSMKRPLTIIEVQANEGDVRAYLEQRIATIPRLKRFVHGNNALQRDIVKTITGNCKGM